MKQNMFEIPPAFALRAWSFLFLFLMVGRITDGIDHGFMGHGQLQ